MGAGELILGGLLLKALSGSSSSTPAPPKTPVQPDAGGGEDKTLDNVSKVGGAGVGLVTTLLGGGGAAKLAGGGSAVAGGTGTALSTGGATTAATTGTLSSAGGATGASAVQAGIAAGITFGGAFVLGWLAYFFLQFVVINIVVGASVRAIQFRQAAARRGNAILQMQLIELELVKQTLERMRVPYTWTAVTDRRLDTLGVAANDSDLLDLNNIGDRAVIANPFVGEFGPAEKWPLLQLAARVTAMVYAIRLNGLANNFLKNWLGQPSGGDVADQAQMWSFPMVGGEPPPLPDYTAGLSLMFQLERPEFPFDDVMKAARLAAILNCAAVVQKDPATYFPWDPDWYSARLYNAMGLSGANDGVHLRGPVWLIEPGRFKIPAQQLRLDITELKEGKSMAPFIEGAPQPTATGHGLTCLKADGV